MDALWFMHAKEQGACWAGPRGGFLRHKPFDSHRLDPLQVGDDAHGIPGPIAVVQMPQMRARELGAGKAELVFPGGRLLAVLDRTSNARVRFVAIVPAAARARLPLSNVSAAQPTIHTTRCDEHRVIRANSKVHVCHTVTLI